MPQLVPVSPADTEANSNADAFQSLQVRHQALQATFSEHTLASQATQQKLEQQLCTAQAELQVKTACCLHVPDTAAFGKLIFGVRCIRKVSLSSITPVCGSLHHMVSAEYSHPPMLQLGLQCQRACLVCSMSCMSCYVIRALMGIAPVACVHVQSVCQERSAAVAGLQAMQICDEKARCNLHVGLTQVLLGASCLCCNYLTVTCHQQSVKNSLTE